MILSGRACGDVLENVNFEIESGYKLKYGGNVPGYQLADLKWSRQIFGDLSQRARGEHKRHQGDPGYTAQSICE